MNAPRVLSLCSGYGGLDLAVEEVFSAETIAHAEYEAAPSKILNERWPGVPNLGDLTTVTDWPAAEIVAAGYPCQPDSLAGKGLSVDDHRWIFPDVARAISEVRPGFVVLENVSGHFVRGFRVVLGTLAELGFDAEWALVRASDVGAPHRRERLFVVATNTANVGHERSGTARTGRTGPADGRDPVTDASRDGRNEGRPESTRVLRGSDAAKRGGAATADADGHGLQSIGRFVVERRDAHGRSSANIAWGKYEPAIRRWERLTRLAPAPTETSPKGTRRLSPQFVEWMMGLPAGWVTDADISRNDQLKALGNGVVPQQAAEALRRLLPATAERAA